MPRLLAMLFVLLGLFCAAALPAHAEDYDTVLDRLSRLQALAREYSANQTDTPDPIELTLAYTRTGEYNTTIWQLTAGVRDAGFESCVNSSDPELASLQNMNTVVLPNGESIDFGHLLASMNLVYNGIPITGSWGGDCEELARQYYGQAGDAAGYAEAMRASFNMDDDGTLSRFSNGDLRNCRRYFLLSPEKSVTKHLSHSVTISTIVPIPTPWPFGVGNAGRKK